MTELLRQNEVADVLKVNPQTLRRWRKAGCGPPAIILQRGPHQDTIRYNRASIELWLQSRQDAGQASR